MSKSITNIDLAHIVCRLLLDKDSFDTANRFHSFMDDIAALVTEHCGGEVSSSTVTVEGESMVSISANDSLPEDGGIWKTYDLEGSLSDEKSEVGELEGMRQRNHKIFVVPKNGAMLDEASTDVALQVYFPSLLDQKYEDYNNCPQWGFLEEHCSYRHNEVADLIVHVSTLQFTNVPDELKPIVSHAREAGVTWLIFHLGQ